MSRIVWPIPLVLTKRVGESVKARRAGSGRPQGASTSSRTQARPCFLPTSGMWPAWWTAGAGDRDSLVRAGLFVDVLSFEGWVYRYLHLGSADVRTGDLVRAGQPIGTVSVAGQSGVEHSEPHVHFEIRASDWDRVAGDYGEPIDPLSVLPRRTWLV